jgi:DNA modification methylase
MVFADPPFNLSKEFDTEMEEDEYLDWCGSWVWLATDAIKENGSFYSMTIQEYVGSMMAHLGQRCWFRNQIIWHNSSMPVKNRFCVSYQPILFYVRNIEDYVFNFGVQKRKSTAAIPYGKSNKAGSIRDIWDDIPFVSGGCMASKEAIFEPGTKKKAHPCQMPIALPARAILYSTNEGDLVLDPFMGSGSTLLAAKLNGRRAIGIERSERYCEIAAKRLEQGVLF